MMQVCDWNLLLLKLAWQIILHRSIYAYESIVCLSPNFLLEIACVLRVYYLYMHFKHIDMHWVGNYFLMQLFVCTTVSALLHNDQWQAPPHCSLFILESVKYLKCHVHTPWINKGWGWLYETKAFITWAVRSFSTEPYDILMHKHTQATINMLSCEPDYYVR